MASSRVARSRFTSLSSWETTKEHEESATLRLICCVFSLISEANRKPRIYGTKQPNVVAMLNTWLNSREEVQRCALIFEFLLRSTSLTHLLEGSLGKHIARAKSVMDGNLVIAGEPEWQILEHLVPEIFHRRVREQLRYLSKLPPWAEHEDLPNPSYEPSSLAI